MSLATAVFANNNDTRRWSATEIDSGVIHPFMGYMMDWDKAYHAVPNPGLDEVYRSLDDLLRAEGYATLDEAHADGFVYYLTELEGLTDQIWAVQVEANPGESGTMTQDFEAAYGPFGGWAPSVHTTNVDLLRGLLPLEDGEEADIPDWGDRDWFVWQDEDEIWRVKEGDEYVGNYFNIDQLASTTDGTTKRYISISSPWSHAFIEEDMTVVGMSEIKETFEMDNLLPGEAVVPDWWDLF